MKIYDVVFYFNEKDILERRLNFLRNQVTDTIILNFGSDHLSVGDFFVLPILESFDSFTKKNFPEMIMNFIGKHNINYDDIFIFSKTFEIPTEKEISKFILEKKTGPIFCNQNLYLHTYKTKSIYKHIGTCFAKYHDLMDKTNPQNFIFYNQNHFYNKENTIDGGFALLNFEESSRSLSSLQYWFDQRVTHLTSESLEVYEYSNKNIFIDQKEHSLEIVFDVNLESFRIKDFFPIPKIFTIFYNDFSNENVISNIRLTIHQNESCLLDETYHIDSPVKTFYKSENYFEDYKKNELLKILKNHSPNFFDEVHINTKTEGVPSVFTYDFFRNSVPSDLI